MNTEPSRHQRFWAMLAIATTTALPLVVPDRAAAQPPAGGAPDMSGFTDVTADFATAGPRNTGTIALFSVPGGVNCAMNLDGGTKAQCTGALPGIAGVPIAPGGSTRGECDLGIAQISGRGTALMNHYKGGCSGPSGLKALAPGQKISGSDSTCGVIDNQVSACIAGPHGFVLTPSGSSTF